MYASCPGQNHSEKKKKISQKKEKSPQVTCLDFTYVSIYENVIFLHYRNEIGQNSPRSLFLDAFIKR